MVCVASPGCVAMELGFTIPTPSNEQDWTYVKQFVTSIIRQLDIGRQDHQIQVGVATYRGLSHYASTALNNVISTYVLISFNRLITVVEYNVVKCQYNSQTCLRKPHFKTRNVGQCPT